MWRHLECIQRSLLLQTKLFYDPILFLDEWNLIVLFVFTSVCDRTLRQTSLRLMGHFLLKVKINFIYLSKASFRDFWWKCNISPHVQLRWYKIHVLLWCVSTLFLCVLQVTLPGSYVCVNSGCWIYTSWTRPLSIPPPCRVFIKSELAQVIIVVLAQIPFTSVYAVSFASGTFVPILVSRN